MGNRIIQYYVEGEDDQKVVNTLKTELGVIMTGKVHVLNVVEQEIPDMRLRALSRGTIVVLVFDTDTGNIDILNKNITKLKKCASVSDVVLIPQVSNLEVELVRSCKIKQIKELLNSRSNSDFKRDVIRVTNLASKLKEHSFNFDLFWSQKPGHPYQNIENQSLKIRIKK